VDFSNVDLTYAWDAIEGANGFERMTLFSGTPVRELSVGRIFERVNEVLDQLRPQAVAIPGWYDRCSLAALRWCGAHRVRAVVMSETTAWDDKRKWWKEFLKRRVLKLCSSGLVGGRAHAEYLEQLGIDRKRIFYGYDVVDNDYFARGANEVRSRRAEERIKHGTPEKFFLASARFVEKKNLARLIQAYARYRVIAQSSEISKDKPEIWDLVLLGDGPLKPELGQLIAELNLYGSVVLPGFKQYDELPAYYGLASAFVHASTTEQWGLVVNEAMASGLPVLVSNRCGCAGDLVQEGVNGFTFDPYNIEQLAEQMLLLTHGRGITEGAKDGVQSKPGSNGRPPVASLEDMGRASRQIVETFGVAAFAEGMSQAVAAAMSHPPAHSNLINNLCVSSLVHAIRNPAAENTLAGNSGSKMKETARGDEKFLVFQYKGRDVMAVPRKSKSILLAGVKRYQPFTTKRHLYQTLVSWVIRCGGSRLLAVNRAGPLDKDFGFEPEVWQAELEARLGRRIAHTVVAWPTESSRRRLYVHLLDERLRAFAFVKLALRNEDHAKLETEADRLKELSRISFQTLRAPSLISHGRFGAASYLVTESFPAGAKPFPLKQDWDSRSLTEEFCGQKTRQSGEAMMNLSWWRAYTQALEPAHQAFHDELTRLRPVGADACRAHGDLACSNMVSDGSHIWLVDWELSHPMAPALTDSVGFFMSFTVGKIPDDPAAYLARFQNQFLRDDSEERRLAIMLAVAFRHASGIADAGRLMKIWGNHSD
jgi:glycosyltransferase involved in cell wall biosynthesis